jgi:tRNA dimethylallyltransferase
MMRVLLGPTASGKTSVAIPLALQLGAEIVSVDSRQIFRGMEIGSAAPSLEDRARVTHHLVGEVDPREGMTAGEFGRRGRAVMAEIESRGAVVLLVGGSGLYLRAVLGGLDEGLPRDLRVREALQERAAREGIATLHEELAAVDPETAARVAAGDVHRVTRALEILAVTGEKPSALRRQGRLAERSAEIVIMDRDREDLRRRIRERVAAMVEAGLEGEVRALLASGLDPALPVMKSVGYAETVRYLRGEIDQVTWIETIVVNTRRYAKRQRTWFRGIEGAKWVRVAADEAPEDVAERVLEAFTGSALPESEEE